jgi:hypothetical protein
VYAKDERSMKCGSIDDIEICCARCNSTLVLHSPESIQSWYGWICDWPEHIGANNFTNNDPIYGCPTLLSCDWGICPACYDRVTRPSSIKNSNRKVSAKNGSGSNASKEIWINQFSVIEISEANVQLPQSRLESSVSGTNFDSTISGSAVSSSNAVVDAEDSDAHYAVVDVIPGPTVSSSLASVSVMLFEATMREILLVFTDLADKLITQSEALLTKQEFELVNLPSTTAIPVDMATAVLSDALVCLEQISQSNHRLLLVEYFYDALIVHCVIRIRAAIQRYDLLLLNDR